MRGIRKGLDCWEVSRGGWALVESPLQFLAKATDLGFMVGEKGRGSGARVKYIYIPLVQVIQGAKLNPRLELATSTKILFWVF